MTRFNYADFDIRDAIQRRMDLEDMKAWAAKPTPEWVPLPDEIDYNVQPPITALWIFIRGLRP